MGTRLELQEVLEDLLESSEVYYQVSASKDMKYPAIVYSREGIEPIHADNKKYTLFNRYTLMVIDRMPDNPVINKILELPKSRYDRPYKADNLYHDVITLYY